MDSPKPPRATERSAIEDAARKEAAREEAADRHYSVELGATAAVAVLFLLLRLLAVAHWDWSTVAKIADTFDFGDSFAIAFGTIAAQPVVTGMFVAVLLPLVLLRIFWPAPAHRGQLAISTVLAAAVLIAVAFAMTVTYRNPWTLIGIAAMAALFVLLRLFAHGRLHRVVNLIGERIALIAILGILVLAAVNDTPWMGEEQITTRDAVIDGYVLEEAPGFLHVLTEDREVLIVPTDDVVARRLID